MKEIKLKVSFTTPAFLGNADQVGQWRTPPFKNLIRQWWRIVKAKDAGYDYAKLREAENCLFGQASDKDATRSKLKIRLDKWDCGTGRNSIKSGRVEHINVKKNPNIDAALYLGYGPITTKQTKTYIQPLEDSANLKLRFPDIYEEELINTIQLISCFGTIGSRSRNGWGSLIIEPSTKIQFYKELDKDFVQKYSQNVSVALSRDWPHCIGKDDKGLLIWRTEAKERWEDVIRTLAQIKIDYRTAFEFTCGKPHSKAQERHILSYPITNHDLKYMKNARNPNQLRYKVLQTADNKFYGLVFHVPCRVSDDFFDNNRIIDVYRQLEQPVWQSVHNKLDSICQRLK